MQTRFLWGSEGRNGLVIEPFTFSDGVLIGLPCSEDLDVAVEDDQLHRQRDREQEQEDGHGEHAARS